MRTEPTVDDDDFRVVARHEWANRPTYPAVSNVHILINNAGVGGAGPYGTWNDDAK